MESPKKFITHKSPTQSKRPTTEISSDSFSSQGLTSNNTPDNLNPKLPPPSKVNFESSVKEFIKQSSEIENEIRKLNEICKPITSASSTKRESEPIDWVRLNQILKNCGFTEISVSNNKASYESLAQTFVEVVYEYSSQAGIMQQTKETMKALERENDSLIEANKILQGKVGNGKKRNLEGEVKELEIMTEEMQKKFRRLHEKLKEKDMIIKELRLSAGIAERISIGADKLQENQKMKEVFESYMGRGFREKRKTDLKVMEIIEMYESKKSDSELRIILDEFEVFSTDEVLKRISLLQQESSQLRSIERTFDELHFLLFSRHLPDSSLVKYDETCKDLIKRVSEIKNRNEYLAMITEGVFKALNCREVPSSNEIMSKLQVVSHIRTLFSLDESANEIKTIENLFYFVHEMKLFLQHLRIILHKEDMPLNELLKEVSKRVNNV